MKIKMLLIMVGCVGFLSVAEAKPHHHRHNDGLWLAGSIINLVGAGLNLLNPQPVVVTPAPVVVTPPPRSVYVVPPPPPRPVYVTPPPRPVYVTPPPPRPVYVTPPPRHHGGHRGHGAPPPRGGRR